MNQRNFLITISSSNIDIEIFFYVAKLRLMKVDSTTICQNQSQQWRYDGSPPSKQNKMFPSIGTAIAMIF